jgi:ankyrin repeat protein
MCEASKLSLALFASMHALTCAEAQLHENRIHESNECIITSALVHAMRVAHAACEAALTRVEPMYDADLNARDSAEYALCKTAVASALENAKTIVSALEYASTSSFASQTPADWCSDVAMRAAIDAENIGAVALGVVLLSEFDFIVPPRNLFFCMLKHSRCYANVRVLRMLLSSRKLQSTICDRDENSQTVLMIASWCGNTEAIAMLLTCPIVAASADAVSRHGETALMLAVMQGHVETVKALLACPAVCASAGAANNVGNTALMIASQDASPEPVTLLLACSTVVASAGAANQDGDTALIFASRLGCDRAITALFACPAVVASATVVNDQGNTALMLASRYCHIESVFALLSCHTVIESAGAINKQGLTALMFAATNGYARVVAALLTCPAVIASARTVTREGFTALTLALQHRHMETFNVLADAFLANAFSDN